MERQHGDHDFVFPYHGPDDGHAFVFCGSTHTNKLSFHIGQGNGGEVNKLSGDGLNLEDQVKLICQFCQNSHLKHFTVNSEALVHRLQNPTNMDNLYHLYLIWTTLMKELQGSASLEYIEFMDFPYSFEVRAPKYIWIARFLQIICESFVIDCIYICISNNEVNE